MCLRLYQFSFSCPRWHTRLHMHRWPFRFVQISRGVEEHAQTRVHKLHVRPHKGRWQLAGIAPINHLEVLSVSNTCSQMCSCNHTRARPLPRRDLSVKLSSRMTNALSKHKLQAPFCPFQRIKSAVLSDWEHKAFLWFENSKKKNTVNHVNAQVSSSLIK